MRRILVIAAVALLGCNDADPAAPACVGPVAQWLTYDAVGGTLKPLPTRGALRTVAARVRDGSVEVRFSERDDPCEDESPDLRVTFPASPPGVQTTARVEADPFWEAQGSVSIEAPPTADVIAGHLVATIDEHRAIDARFFAPRCDCAGAR